MSVVGPPCRKTAAPRAKSREGTFPGAPDSVPHRSCSAQGGPDVPSSRPAPKALRLGRWSQAGGGDSSPRRLPAGAGDFGPQQDLRGRGPDGADSVGRGLSQGPAGLRSGRGTHKGWGSPLEALPGRNRGWGVAVGGVGGAFAVGRGRGGALPGMGGAGLGAARALPSAGNLH